MFLKQFCDLRTVGTATPEIVRKMDACVAITADILKILNECLCEIDNFQQQHEVERLEALCKNEYARSVFSCGSSMKSALSNRSVISEKAADAAADLAAKEIHYKLLQEEIHRPKLVQMESELKLALEAEYNKLKKTRSQKRG